MLLKKYLDIELLPFTYIKEGEILEEKGIKAFPTVQEINEQTQINCLAPACPTLPLQ